MTQLFLPPSVEKSPVETGVLGKLPVFSLFFVVILPFLVNCLQFTIIHPCVKFVTVSPINLNLRGLLGLVMDNLV